MKKLLLGVMMTVGLLVSGGVSLANDYTPCNSGAGGVNDIPEIECKALVDFYYSTNGDGWTKGFSGWAGETEQIGWLTGDKAGKWRGMVVSSGHVIQMGTNNRLSNNNLSGTLNPSLGNLTEIEMFYVHDNPHLVGTLPKELRSWKKLKGFYIHKNGFDGELPPEFSEWENIVNFEVWSNHFKGTLPKEYAQWTTIGSFYPEANQFEGELPPEYGQWNTLNFFSATNNKLTGTLPDSYGNWTGIIRFEVGNNQLYGTIPPSYANRLGTGWSRLGFNIQHNMFTGDIPEGFKNWQTTANVSGFVYVSDNCLNTDLTGDIGDFLDVKAMEMGWSGGRLGNSLTSFVGSGWRTTQNHCPPLPPVPLPPAPNYGGGGGGSVSLKKDTCPTGDFSPSYYDRECGTAPNDGVVTGLAPSDNNAPTDNDIPTNNTPPMDNANIIPTDNEISTAYQRAYTLGITTLAPLENANPDGFVIRSHMAKMMVNYATKILGKTPDFSKDCSVFDESIAVETDELREYMTLACQLNIMGINPDTTPINDFMPKKEVSRAEFGTVLSRLLYGEKYNLGETYYSEHLKALKNNGIMTQIDTPESSIELRQRVRVMLMRSVR